MKPAASGRSTVDIRASSGAFPAELVRLDRGVTRGWDVRAAQVAFDPSRFEFGLFEAHGIACPDSIRHSVERRQAEFFFGRWAAASALVAIGRPAVEIPIGRSREPVWPAGVTGSISHTDGMAVACVTEACGVLGVGIDVERIPTDEVLREIEALTSSATERAWLDRLALTQPHLSSGLLHTLLFSAKESLFKAVSPTLGRPIDFTDVVLTGFDPQRRKLHLAVRDAPGAPAAHTLRSMTASYELLDDGVVMTFCLWTADADGDVPQPSEGGGA